jgi:protein-L-isoaspartate(D-aspartate) O-methyltransferase
MNRVAASSSQETMIQTQVIDRGIRDERLLAAMRSVPRDRFFPEEYRNQSFADRATAIGFGQTISQPYIVALMTQRLDVQAHHKVLEIGTGSGYQTAILARLAADVYTIERIKPLLDEAWERVMELGIRNVRFRLGDGTLGWSEAAPFDRMIITAGAPQLPTQLLLSHLKDDGIAVLPIGAMEEQMLVQVRRRGNNLEATDVSPCRFVKLIGEEGWKED